ncbi:MAG: phage tail assembly chaperone [Hyphomicrobiaceae bacterium]
MAAGFGLLGLTPGAFWALTLKEFDAALRGRLGVGNWAKPPSRSDVTALMAQYPDQQ